MPATYHDQIQVWLSHIKALAVDIGPRGSTTEGERRGSEYCQAILDRMGLKPGLESFQSAVSNFDPHFYAAVFMLAAFFIYPMGGRLTAALAAGISILAYVSEVLELGFKPNLLRKMVRKGSSQNVFSVLPPSGEHKKDLVLIGHVDSQHTPIIFKTRTWVKVYSTFTTVAFVLFAIQIILFTLGIFFQWSWIWYAVIPSAICAFLLAAMCLQANLTPYTAGANDNASAVGMVLTLAEEIQKNPLQHTRVYFVCTGCEETQHYGAIDFFNRHRSEMVNPKGIVFELVGCAGPGYLTQEGIVVPFHSDAELLSKVTKLSSDHPDWGAYPVQINGGNSELADCVRFKVPAITIFGLTRDGEAPYWHMMTDTFDKMNPEVMENTYALTWALIQEIDKETT
jgi:hypothetical protein